MSADYDPEAPPIVVVVQGSRQSGKSTLIRSLVKHYTNYRLGEIKGSVTVRTSRKQRVTFFECPSNVGAMIDLGKIADLALVLIDASVGFEMETFEFLTIMQTHGFPSVMGVLTHLDHYKESKQLKKTKKRMKKRFWKEVYEGAKLFYLSGTRYEMYWKNEIRNLARYISVIKVKQLEWKSRNPYILVDRYDISPTVKENDKTLVSFYGYVRGAPYNQNSKSYITGLGDYTMNGISLLADPCPTLAMEKLEKEEAKKKRRTLNQKEKILYAPMTNLDFASIDHSNGYITIPDKYVFYTDMPGVEKRDGGEAQKIMKELQEPSRTLDQQFESADPEILPGLTVDPKAAKEEEEMKDEEIKVPDIGADDIPETFAEAITKAIYNETEDDINAEDTSRFVESKLLSQEEYVKLAKKKFITGVDPLKDEEKDKVSEEEEESGSDSMGDEKEKKWVQLEQPEARKEEVDAKVKEFLDPSLGIYTKGKYLKLDTMIENKYLSQFLPQFPVLVCGFHQQEGNLGYLRTRVKKHRWYPKVLKTFDPLIISIGWRRLQTIFSYIVEDPNERRRVIKYTPKFDFCQGICYGPLFPQHTAFLGIQTLSEDAAHFRIAATGDVLEVAQHFPVMKKLKLIGEPMKVFKNTAFVKGMFNSKTEVAKYIGAAVRTVSGIRGQIKKPVNEGPEGTFRATFEDKLQMSDLVFCRTWYQIKLPQLYNPITSYGRQRLMRTTAELREDLRLEPEEKKDSEYKEVVREKKLFAPLVVPKSIMTNLPFKAKEKVKEMESQEIHKKETKNLLKSLSLPSEKPLKILLSEKEKKMYAMVQRLNTLKNIKVNCNIYRVEKEARGEKSKREGRDRKEGEERTRKETPKTPLTQKVHT
eukprot:TRINITY_DN8722_c0_g2_i5.p1 TRINITY_DN8722_c0_g2~~TRINITY_DN8722_c0_g2_i5.p1  ORF type:complete len:872 (+),score=316.28 TRINITY_DN8722_c0_g2_i5:111-2726(+)